METINEFFALFVKLGPFCTKYTNIDPKRRLYHNLKGYDTAGKKVDAINPEDKAELKKGLGVFIADAQKLHDSM